MKNAPFLTKLDSRAAVKGSRDPLGIQSIWTRLGRHVVGNLTTVSNTVTDFTTVLLGYYFAELLAEERGPGMELETFLKWEQLAGYARGEINSDWGFRGTERARERVTRHRRAVLSASRNEQIMSDQKTYGLWGLYTMPARASGLLEGTPPRLTLAAREQVEMVYLPLLESGAGRGAKRIVHALSRPTYTIDFHRPDAALLEAVAKIHSEKLRVKEIEFYRKHLLEGGPTDTTVGLQRQLADLLEPSLGQEDFLWSPVAVGHYVKSAGHRGSAWQPLADRLERIRVCESVMAPISMAFFYLLSLDGKAINLATQRLKEQWGSGLRTVDSLAFRDLRAELAPEDPDTADRWIAIADAASSGKYERLVHLLVQQNRSVMVARGGASWIEEREKALHVRYREEQGVLPPGSEAGRLWKHPYFLDSLREVARLLRSTK